MRFVFIHGAGCTASVWDAQRRAFPDSIAPSLPGHACAGSGDSIDVFASEIESVLEASDIADAILCGNSMGAAIALQLALRHNARVRALVLLGGGAKLRVAPALLDSLEADFETGARALAPLFYAEPTKTRVDASVAMLLEVGAKQTLRDFRACDAFDVTGRLGHVDVPTLALTGDSDVMTPPKFAQFLADRISEAQVRILPNTGHLAMLESLGATNDALRQFVAQVDPDNA